MSLLDRISGSKLKGAMGAFGVVAAVGAAALIPTMATASAQAGSRICGYVWTHSSNNAVIARVAEVSLDLDTGQCSTATNSYNHKPGNDQIKDLLSGNLPSDEWTQSSISWRTCEEFGRQLHTNDDPCNVMNRSDKTSRMQEYMWGSNLSNNAWTIRYKAA